jgi:hypothetical protein
MVDPPALVEDPVDWARPRARILGTAFAVGAGVGLLATAGLVLLVDGRRARTTVFALGTLLFGFGVLGWSGSAMAGRGIENAQAYMETNTDWSERDSRRAMTRIAGFGAGVMVGVSVVGSVARAVAAVLVGT